MSNQPSSSQTSTLPSHRNGDRGSGVGDEGNTSTLASSSDQRGARPQQDSSKESPPLSRWPVWITANLRNPHSWKMVIRCWVASWVAILLLLPNKSLTTLGQAGFFVCMVTIMLPSNMPVALWFIANFTLVLGASLGWAWGCAAMAAALRARDGELLQRQVATVQSSVASATNPEAAYRLSIFQAEFLDPRSSAVFGVFLAVGGYLSGLISAWAPKLKLTSIFMVIVLDVMCVYGPLFPVQQYTLGTIFLLPIGCAVGIGFACMLFIFPETLSHIWQGNMVKLLRTSKDFVAVHDDAIRAMAVAADPQTLLRETQGKLREIQSRQVQLIEVMDGQKGFLHIEATFSALSSTDLVTLLQPTKQFTLRIFGLLNFHYAMATVFADDHRGDHEEGGKSASHEEKPSHKTKGKSAVHIHDTHALMTYRRRVHDAEQRNHVSLQEGLLPIVLDASRELIYSVREAVDAVSDWLEYANEHRWRGQWKQDQHASVVARLSRASDSLAHELDRFTNSERIRLIKPYETHFQSADGALDEKSAREFRAGARSLFVCLVMCSSAVCAGRELQALVQTAHDIALRRPKSRLWMPKGLRKLGHLIVSRKGKAMEALPDDRDDEPDHGDGEEEHDKSDDENVDDDDDDDNSSSAKEKEEEQKRLGQKDADALPPRHVLHHFGRFLARCYHFFWSPESVFALRFTIAGIVVFIPSVATQSSADFAYHERFLWALIMAQLGVALTYGEQVFSIVSRVFGTVAGALLGAALWYISCGKAAQGNVYGFGAVTAVAFVPLLFLRLYAPPQLLIAAIMLGVTTILVLGYSWIDAGHLAVTANSGIGIEVAWRRMLLVMAGIAVSILVMLFPRPPSSRERVRLSFAKLSGKRILRLYSDLIQMWAAQAPTSPAALQSHFRNEFIAALTQTASLRAQIGLAKLDLQLRGPWPASRYEQLLGNHQKMLSSLSQLYLVTTEPDYDATWRRRFAHMTALLDAATISDVCATLTMLGQALHSGLRLPHAASLVRERAIRSQLYRAHVEERLRAMGSPEASEPLSLATLRSPQFMHHVAGTVALTVFMDNLDEAMAVCRDLVGEVPLPGYEELKDRWDERAILTAV